MRKSNPAQAEYPKISTIEVQKLTLPGREESATSSAPLSPSASSVANNQTATPTSVYGSNRRKNAKQAYDIAKTQYVHRPEARSGGDTQLVHRPEVDGVFRTRPLARNLGESRTVFLDRTEALIRPNAKATDSNEQDWENPAPVQESESSSNTSSIVPAPETEWPLAWLVAITGPMKGKFFVITSGENYIGQARDNSISLINDPDVSARQNSIHYDAEYRAFYIDTCPNAQQITKLSDGDTVNSCTPLEHGEILKVSPNTKLRFVPFCGETFNW